MNISDVIIHINENLDKEARQSLENKLREIEGVVSPGFNKDHEHLLMITYNTDKTSTDVLLTKTRAAGYNAQLVGM